MCLLYMCSSHANSSYTFHASKKANEEESNFFPKNKKDIGMAHHTPPFKEAQKQGELSLPIFSSPPSQEYVSMSCLVHCGNA